MTIYLGCDPGLTGGLVYIEGDVYQGIPMPVGGHEIDAAAVAAYVRALQARSSLIATVESVHSMPKQGVASTFKFGKGYGMVLGVLAALGVRTELVTPQRWKGLVLAGTAKDKDAAVEWCQRCCPDLNLIMPRCRVPHIGLSDAACIATYGRRTYPSI